MKHAWRIHGTSLSIVAWIPIMALASSCALVRSITGTDIDPDRFAKAREARVMELRADASARLLNRLAAPDPIDNADLLFAVSEEALNKAAAQLDSARGWLDADTRMMIRHASVKLYNGVAIVTLDLDAVSESYPVAVQLAMDCILYLELDSAMRLAGKLEAFNIIPVVEAGGLLRGQEELIRNLISIKLASLGERLPPFVFPLEFEQNTAIDRFQTRSREKIDLTVSSPRRLLQYTFRLKEIILFRSKALIALNLASVEVK